VGEAVVTPAFDLPATFIIHTVGPVWETGDSEEKDMLKSCYLNSLELAYQYKCSSIAFPLISSGVYGFPKDVAIDIAKAAINEFLETHEMEVYLVVFDDASLVASKERFKSIKEFVDSEYVKAKEEAEYGADNLGNTRPMVRAREMELLYLERSYAQDQSMDEDEYHRRRQKIVEAKDLKELIGGKQISFGVKYFEFMMKKGMDPTDVYTGYYDRRINSKMINLEGYHPNKSTAIMACLGLKLTLSEADELLATAGYTFNMHFDPDVIVMYCIINKKYRLMDINYELTSNGLPEFHQIY